MHACSQDSQWMNMSAAGVVHHSWTLLHAGPYCFQSEWYIEESKPTIAGIQYSIPIIFYDHVACCLKQKLV